MQIVGVIGAGQMGVGIAQTAAQTGHKVLSDVSLTGRAGQGRDRQGIEPVGGQGEDGRGAGGRDPGRDHAGRRYRPHGAADIIIEAATEREDIKLKIFESTATVLGADAVLATNTSSLSITRMSRAAPDQGRFIGMHSLIRCR
jgi:3-hydroxybutyryl-CoA dehydrogenase